MPVIFRGRVIDHNHDPAAGFEQMTLYRFEVLEAFKGIPPGKKGVFIDPASMSSCYTQFVLDRDYLVYTGGGGSFAGVTVVGDAWRVSPVKQIPVAWKGLEHSPVYSGGTCNPTRTIKENDPDLAYLRSAAKGSPQADGWIEGRAMQNYSWASSPSEFVSVADAVLALTSAAGDRRATGVQADGTFKIGPVPPGVYTVSAQSPALGNGKVGEPEVDGDPEVDVPAGGCAVVLVSFETGSTVSGTVLDADGKPARGIWVELGELQDGGHVRGIPQTWADTDRDGTFKISNVPVGRVLLAANLSGAPTASMPFDTVYAPGTENIAGARVFAIQRDAQVTGVSLRLPRSLPFGDLYVDVMWPDGTPALGGARAWARWNGAEAGFEPAPSATNRVKLRLALERKYEIQVEWIDAKPGKLLSVEGAELRTLDFTRDGQILELRLKTPRPQ